MALPHALELGRRQGAVAALQFLLQEREEYLLSRLTELRSDPMHRLWRAVSHAEALGLDPLRVMAERLHIQIDARRKELLAVPAEGSRGS